MDNPVTDFVMDDNDRLSITELYSEDVEVVSTWKDDGTNVNRLSSTIFSLESIFATLKEIPPTISFLRASFIQDTEITGYLSKFSDLLTFYEDHIRSISTALNGETPLPHHGGIYTFLKLIVVNWNRLKEVIEWWKYEIQEKNIAQRHFLYRWMRATVVTAFNSSAALYNTSLRPTSALFRVPLAVLPLTQSRSAYDLTTDAKLNGTTPTRAQYIAELEDRKFELEQLAPLLPLMLLVVRAQRAQRSDAYLSADHVAIFDFEEAERIPAVAPFWYKYNTNMLRFSSVIYATYATMGESQKAPDIFRKYAYGFTTAIRCSLDPNHATKRGHEVQSQNVDIAMLQGIWNLLDIPILQAITELSYPLVAVSQIITIPAPRDGPLQGMPITARIISSKPLPFDISHLFSNNTSYVSSLTRVLSTNSLRGLFTRSLLEGPVRGNRASNLPETSIILHFHGGGFVSGSSAMHENYLREWAISTGVPIISVDYRLAPDHRFPIAVEECFHVYKWLMNPNHLGAVVTGIAVVGDSAGGNLAAGVTIKCISEGIPTPTGAILVYPCLDVCRTSNPSRLLFKNDPLVSLSVMKVIRDSYFPQDILSADQATQDNFSKNPLLSPLHVPDDILAQFPPVYICAGEFDPLLDESLAFAKRLKVYKKLRKLQIYEGLPHGFLSISDKYVVEGMVAVKDTAVHLKEILSVENRAV